MRVTATAVFTLLSAAIGLYLIVYPRSTLFLNLRDPKSETADSQGMMKPRTQMEGCDNITGIWMEAKAETASLRTQLEEKIAELEEEKDRVKQLTADLAAASAGLTAKRHTSENMVQTIVSSSQSEQNCSNDGSDIFAAAVEGQETSFDPDSLTITYETCMESLKQRKSNKKTFEGTLYWLHIPKCGTSFGSALHGYTCQSDPSPPRNPNNVEEECLRCGPDAKNWRGFDHTIVDSIPWENRPYCDWNISFHGAFKNHLVLPASNDYTSPSHFQAVALFRDPRRRLVSGWNDNKHSYSMGSWYSPRGPIEEVALMRNSTQTIEEYAAWPGIASCQTKMLLGEDCSVPINITEAQFEEAHRRLLNMPFVGLTDAFNASVCLFHHQFGGLPEKYMFTTHARSGEQLLKRKLLQCKVGFRLPRSAWKNLSKNIDPIDYRLYEAARDIFTSRLEKYRLWTPNHNKLTWACTHTDRRPLKRACRFKN